jgi:hypothetical protein
VLLALPIVGLVILVGGCGSVMYLHALWETGNHRCGEQMMGYSGWHIGFNGETDAFVCTVRDGNLRAVAQKEIPVENVMGTSGRLPLFPELIAYGLEGIDGDAP